MNHWGSNMCKALFLPLWEVQKEALSLLSKSLQSHWAQKHLDAQIKYYVTNKKIRKVTPVSTMKEEGDLDELDAGMVVLAS